MRRASLPVWIECAPGVRSAGGACHARDRLKRPGLSPTTGRVA